MSACCIFVAFVIFILFSSRTILFEKKPNTQHVASGGIGGYEVDILWSLLDEISIR